MSAPGESKLSQTQYYTISNFKFENGDTLPEVKLAYQILNTEHKKVAVVHTCFKGRLDGTLTHSSGAFKGHRIILIALLGNGESSSPSNTSNFPKTLEYMDCVRAEHALLTKELKIETVDAMLGFSMGGQITYHWITMYPKFVRKAIIVCSSARTSRHNFQFLEGPRAALESAKDEESGKYAFGKAYSAWLTSAEWFDDELYKAMGAHSLAAWDKAVMDSYHDWSGKDLLAMLGMWQRGDIVRCVPQAKGDLGKALQTIAAKVLLIPCETDQYFRPYVNEREKEDLNSATVAVISSIWGHIVGGDADKDATRWMDDKIQTFLHE
ncbi:alpha/beta-hydrolase [Karstenula rhodostoma CBS 690.94]|uniref:Alpha/beta-hydrolase n=1 Tax=Karstenula rhodostoma CBS 690.94 TaxID=1392251 RepID=A0A9P4PVT6_9PLEO|nr:alpha/beta-hydrolase [Karstenula rhodostoma CBS 690.94]